MPRARGKRRNAEHFKWTKEFIFLLVGLAILVAVTIVCLIPTSKERFYNSYQGTDSNTTYLAKDNCFKEISYKKFQKIVDASGDEPVFVYYTTPSDSTCVSNIQVLNTYAENYKIDTIYVLDATEIYNISEDDSNYEKELSEKVSKQDYLNEKKASQKMYISDTNTGKSIDDIDLTNYSQLWVFEKGAMVYSSQTILDDKYMSDSVSFTFALIKMFYSLFKCFI